MELPAQPREEARALTEYADPGEVLRQIVRSKPLTERAAEAQVAHPDAAAGINRILRIQYIST